jgi:polysaccharide biosynthesis protein PslG
VHFGPGYGSLAWATARFKNMYLSGVRQVVLWEWVEPTKGNLAVGASLAGLDDFLQKCKAAGVEPLIILAYGNALYDPNGFPLSAEAQNGFARYAAFLAKRYKGIVKRYEVWNEWNIGMGTHPPKLGDPAVYTALLKKVYPALKAVDPEIVVLGGAISAWADGFANQLFQMGALDYMDGFSVHPYVYPDVPETAMNWLDGFESRASSAAGGREVPIYVTEIGWPTYAAKDGVDPAVAAAYLARFYLLAPTRSFIKGVWWYDFFDDGPDPSDKENNFGLVHYDGSPKPAACAMTQIAKLLAEYRPIAFRQEPNGLLVVKYADSAGFVYAVWAQKPGASVSAIIEPSGVSASGISGRGICGDNAVKSSTTNSVSAEIGNSPVLFATTAADIVIK